MNFGSGEGDLRHTLSPACLLTIWADLAGSIVFPLCFAAFRVFGDGFCGALNVAAAESSLVHIIENWDLRRIWRAGCHRADDRFVLQEWLAGSISKYVEGGLYQDTIFFYSDGEYQKIVVIVIKMMRPFIDGNLHSLSDDTDIMKRWFMCLWHRCPQRVLILE